jgi:hypothetical protein
MKIVNPPTSSGYTIFCDDIRREDNGKYFFIGVYFGEMIISPKLPIVLPTFVAFVNYRVSPGETAAPVVAKLFVPGSDEAIAAVDVPIGEMTQSAAPIVGEDTSATISTLIPIRLSPFVVEQEGLIKVRAYRGGEEIRLGALRVSVRPPEI